MKLAIGTLLAAAVLASLVAYPQLPDSVATHWNAAGEVDGWMPKAVGAFVGPAIMLVVTGIFSVLPRISPKGYELEQATRAYRAILAALLLFLAGLHVVTLAWNLGYPVSIGVAAAVLLGVLLAVLGNYLSKVPRNIFIGVRTPWTLADEDVWFRTHRVAARTFTAGGLAVAVLAPLAGERYALPVVIAGVIVAAVIPVIYSYAIYRKEARS